MATLARGRTFGTTEEVTAAKLHSLVDDGSISGITQVDIAAGEGLVVRSGTNPSDIDSLWIDTSETPPRVKLNTGTRWESTSPPVGSTIVWPTDTAPTGWILCDGSAQNAVTNTALQPLFDVIGTTFGGADNTDFQVPDMRGRFALGQDDMGGASANRVTNAQADALAGSEGTEAHTLVTSEMPAHTHDFDFGNAGSGTEALKGDTDNDTILGAKTSKSTGGGGSHENMPPYLTMNYIIKL